MAGSFIDQDYGFAVPLCWEGCVSKSEPGRLYIDLRLTLFTSCSRSRRLLSPSSIDLPFRRLGTLPDPEHILASTTSLIRWQHVHAILADRSSGWR